MQLDGIPDRVDRSVVLAFLTSLGIDILQVNRDGGVHIGHRSIEVELAGLDAEGNRYIDFGLDPHAVATHRVCIPIVDERCQGDPDTSASNGATSP